MGLEFPVDQVHIRNGELIRNGQLIGRFTPPDLAALYHQLGLHYSKFFKMDGLCKLAWIAAETLLIDPAGMKLYEDVDKSRVALMIATTDGCLDIDHRFKESMADISSPALFVYTLPNIMLGEICIRHGFTGEQLCLYSDELDLGEMLAQLKDLVANRGVSHCLFGKVDAAAGRQEAVLFWADATTILALDTAALNFTLNES